MAEASTALDAYVAERTGTTPDVGKGRGGGGSLGGSGRSSSSAFGVAAAAASCCAAPNEQMEYVSERVGAAASWAISSASFGYVGSGAAASSSSTTPDDDGASGGEDADDVGSERAGGGGGGAAGSEEQAGAGRSAVEERDPDNVAKTGSDDYRAGKVAPAARAASDGRSNAPSYEERVTEVLNVDHPYRTRRLRESRRGRFFSSKRRFPFRRKAPLSPVDDVDVDDPDDASDDDDDVALNPTAGGGFAVVPPARASSSSEPSTPRPASPAWSEPTSTAVSDAAAAAVEAAEADGALLADGAVAVAVVVAADGVGVSSAAAAPPNGSSKRSLRRGSSMGPRIVGSLKKRMHGLGIGGNGNGSGNQGGGGGAKRKSARKGGGGGREEGSSDPGSSCSDAPTATTAKLREEALRSALEGSRREILAGGGGPVGEGTGGGVRASSSSSSVTREDDGGGPATALAAVPATGSAPSSPPSPPTRDRDAENERDAFARRCTLPRHVDDARRRSSPPNGGGSGSNPPAAAAAAIGAGGGPSSSSSPSRRRKRNRTRAAADAPAAAVDGVVVVDGDSGGVPATSWSPSPGTQFSVRAGPNYKSNKTKRPSRECLYETVCCRSYKSNRRTRGGTADVLPPPPPPPPSPSSREGAPVDDGPGKGDDDDDVVVFEGWEEGRSAGGPTIPRIDDEDVPELLIVHFMLPHETPSVFKSKDDGYGNEVVFYLRPSRRFVDEVNGLSPLTPASSLFVRWSKRCVHDDDVRSRFKCMALVHDIDRRNLPGMLKSYNGKPVLITESGTARRGSTAEGVRYLEMSANVHHWSYVAKKGFVSLLPRFKDLRLDVGFVIEATDDSEMPECMLGSATMNYVNETTLPTIDSELQRGGEGRRSSS